MTLQSVERCDILKDVNTIGIVRKPTFYESRDMTLLPPDEIEHNRRLHDEHYRNVDLVIDTLSSRYKRIVDIDVSNNRDIQHDLDIIIGLGGDGTALDAASLIWDDTPFITLQTKDESVGALCEEYAKNIKIVLTRLQDGDYHTEKWTRARLQSGGVDGLALNEVAFGALYWLDAKRYHVRKKSESATVEENHIASGIIASTGSGSTAWYKTAGGIPFPRTSPNLEYLVLGDQPDSGYALKHGILLPGEKLFITSRDVETISACDSDRKFRMYDVPFGHTCTFSVSDHPLTAIRFPQ